MPAMATKNATGHVAGKGGIWAKHRDSITAEQLQRFWSELPFDARQELLKVDKQTLFEQARKNLYCSRCNGLLLDSFSQIVLHGKSMQQGDDLNISNQITASEPANEDEEEDPSMLPWGGLAITRDGTLTILDDYICAKSLKKLQSVFDSAQARERERELLYPDACGGGGRGWISQAMTSYGRGHGSRETCALHTARLSCDTLVDFWSALGEETRSSLFRMKEEDFIERLMFRFDSKRFCRDCRRNVIREFKELKELKRMRREPRCTSWFCAADSAFEYEVSEDTVQVDWRQFLADSVGMYHHFEWAIGTAEGKSDILDFEDIGMNDMVEVNGLDLGGLSACFITLRAWKLDGRCSEFCVKAHALKGQQCVHRRLTVGDGYVAISKGESIRRYFEHAEEAEEEEDDDSVDKDVNDIDGGVSRPQKHAKSPELAREFLLDAATVIFKEQVEKAFREGTARQNAHSIFICLALKLLEERLHVACKEIITLAKQTKLLEEEEREKREEEERKERRKAKEREKKLRRKERLKGKERENKSNSPVDALHSSSNDSSTSTLDDLSNTPDSGDSVSESGDSSLVTSFEFLDISRMSCEGSSANSDTLQKESHADGNVGFTDGPKSFSTEHSKIFGRPRNRTDSQHCYDMGKPCTSDESSNAQSERDFTGYSTTATCINALDRAPRDRPTRNNPRNCDMKFNKFYFSSARGWDQHDPCELQSCDCKSQIDRRVKDGSQMPRRSVRDTRNAYRTEYAVDQRSSLYHNVRLNTSPGNGAKSKGKIAGYVPGREAHVKQVWEPLDARKKSCRSSSDHKTASCDVSIDQLEGIGAEKPESHCDQPANLPDPVVGTGSLGGSKLSDDVDLSKLDESNFASRGFQDDVELMSNSDCYSKMAAKDDMDCCIVDGSESFSSSSSSDNCSSCPSEGDGSTSSSSAQNAETSSTSESEEQYEGSKFQDPSPDINKNGGGLPTNVAELLSENHIKANLLSDNATKSLGCDNSQMGQMGSGMLPHPKYIPEMQSYGMNASVLPSQGARYTSCSPTWLAASDTAFFPLPQQNQYAFSRPLRYVLPVNQPTKYGVHYSTIQTSGTPRYDAIRNSSFQEVNCMHICSNERGNKFGPNQLNTFVEPMQCPQKVLPIKPACAGENGHSETTVMSHQNTTFSLFHFGGHVAGYPIGLALNPQLLNQENKGVGSDSSFGMVHSCSDQEIKMEEYSLFSTRNAGRFSFLY